LDEPVIRDLKLLSVDLDKRISDLLAEAISDLLRKYGWTEVVYSTVAPETKKERNDRAFRRSRRPLKGGMR
jgi:hypothetical protein